MTAAPAPAEALAALGAPDGAAPPAAALDALAREWRAATPALADRLALADALWAEGGPAPRIAAAKLLTQARIADDGPVWDRIARWTREVDGPALAEALGRAGERRLSAEPSRLDELEGWTRAPVPWLRRAAFDMAAPWARGRHPAPADLARRDRVLGWAAACAKDGDAVVQMALAGWLRALGKHDPERLRAFLDAHGPALKPFAATEAARALR